MITERWLELRGRRTRWLETGSGRPVVLVHGIGLSGDVWREGLEALGAEGWRALAPDLPGFGESAGPPLGTGLDELSRWLLELAAAIEADGAAWVGHSLMGGTVLRLAAEGRARAIVLVSPTIPPRPFGRLRQLGRLLRDVPRERPRILAAVLRQYVRASTSAAAGTWLKNASIDPVALARRVRCPALVLAGAEDPMNTAGALDLLRSALPDGRLVEVDGAAHALALAHQERTFEAVRSFLRQVYPP